MSSLTFERIPASGVGLGLRRSMVKELQQQDQPVADFLEVAPENWMELGGRLGEQFQWFIDRYPMMCHGLSLSIGSTEPLDVDFLKSLKVFFNKFNVVHYSEHLSYCSADGGHLYDLMPLPFTEEAVKHVSNRIRQVQDILEQKISMENVSYYATIHKNNNSLSESEFINAVLSESDCHLLLDVNNIYVNSINHRYDASQFLRSMPAERVSYFHVAGHYDEADDLKIDTHGADVKDPVWDLLAEAYEYIGMRPTLLERDFNIPPLKELLTESAMISRLQSNNKKQQAAA